MSRLTHVTAGPYAPPSARRELVAESADGARLHVEVHGDEDAPAVVLAHGWTCSTAFWAAQVRELARDHKVIAYDQRGHGRSPATGVFSTGALADDLVAVLAATLGEGERAVVAGHSMGGMTIMAAAGLPGFDDRVSAALLCSTGAARLPEESTVVPMRPGPARTRITRTVMSARTPLGPVTPVAKKAVQYVTMAPGTAPHKVDACARIVHACPPRVRHEWSKVLAGLDVRHNLARLTVPTAVIGGTADRLTPIVHSRGLAAELPHCVGLTELTGMGHMTPIEAPEAVTGVIRGLVGIAAAGGTDAGGSGAGGTDAGIKEKSV